MTESSAHVSPVYSLTLFGWSFCVGCSALGLDETPTLLLYLLLYGFVRCSLPLSLTSSAQLIYRAIKSTSAALYSHKKKHCHLAVLNGFFLT